MAEVKWSTFARVFECHCKHKTVVKVGDGGSNKYQTAMTICDACVTGLREATTPATYDNISRSVTHTHVSSSAVDQ